MLPNVARVIIINSTNSSGASLETMAGKNRVVITATRSATEANDTVFYEHFLAALQDSAADEDKDKKVSVWETFKFASDAVDRFYKEQGRLATEHPMLSDNGGEAVNTTVKDPPVLSRYTVSMWIVRSQPPMRVCRRFSSNGEKSKSRSRNSSFVKASWQLRTFKRKCRNGFLNWLKRPPRSTL
jgi:hypothetical protein